MSVTKKKKEKPFSVMLLEQATKLDELTSYCTANNVRCGKGQVVRMLLEAAENNLEFVGLMRARVEKEKSQSYELRYGGKKK
jgi:hypothetical protein